MQNPVVTILNDNVDAYNNLKKEKEKEKTDKLLKKIEGDIAIGKDIHMRIVPSKFPAFPDRKVHAIMQPTKTVGGYLYNYFLIDDQHLFFIIKYVSDKVVSAALFMSMTQTLFKTDTKAGQKGSSIGQLISEVGAIN